MQTWSVYSPLVYIETVYILITLLYICHVYVYIYFDNKLRMNESRWKYITKSIQTNKTFNLLMGQGQQEKERKRARKKTKSDGFIIQFFTCWMPFFVSLYELYVNRKFRLVILRICIIVCMHRLSACYSMSVSLARRQ